MFWVILLTILIIVLILDEKAILDKQTTIKDDLLINTDYFYFNKKVIPLNSITNLDLRVINWFWYPKQAIQVTSEGKNITLSRITLFNYKQNSSLVTRIIQSNPNILLNNELKMYLHSNSIGDYYINKEQIKRGFIVILLIAGLFLLAYLENVIKKMLSITK